MTDKTYMDDVLCPRKHQFRLARRVDTAGRSVRTFCPFCQRSYQITAGSLPAKRLKGNE
jgi:uncharacterized protein YbaR (Trm112 family)